MIVGDVMDQIGVQLDTISGLRVLDYEADDINVPAALVSLPVGIDYLGTYKRGMDSMIIQVTILVSMVSDRVRRDKIAPYADGAGSKSVKQVLEAGVYTAFHVLTVASATFDVVDIADVEYLAVIFICNIAGSGN
jgi:hypothetical protein